MSKQFWKFANNETNGHELILEGVIASESWFGDEVTPQQFRDELKEVSGNLTVRINSPGGDVFAGMAIMNALKDREGYTTVIVDGLAASIASVIAMAGDKIVMNTGSMMMIHNAWSMAAGDSKELRKVAETLDQISDTIISVYETRTGLSVEELKSMLDEETWMSAEEAVEMGFADEAKKGKTKLSNMVKNVLSLATQVNDAVAQPAMSIKAKLEVVNEQEVEEQNVTDTTETVDEVVTEESVTTESTEETEAEEVTESEVTEEINNSVKEETPKMNDEIVKAQVIEPSAQAPVEGEVIKRTYADYLKSDKAMEDFANVLRENAGKSAQDVKAGLQKVAFENGLTDADYFKLPEPVITSILDAVKTSGIYNAVNKTGLDIWRVVYDDTDANVDTSRAGGHAKGDTKDEQVLDFDDRTLRPQMIYKYLVLDKETILENRSTGALIRFVMNELPTRIIREIERAIVIGDGRATNNKRKIHNGVVKGFFPIKDDATAGNTFASTYFPAVGESKYESLLKAKAMIDAEGEVAIISKKGYLTDLLLEQNANGGYIFAPGTDVARALGFGSSFEPTWLNDTTDPDNDAYLVVLSAYKTVGQTNIEAFTNFKLETNENEFLDETYQGGGLSEIKAAVAIAKEGASS